MANFGTNLIEADEQLRQCAASPDLGTIESVLSNIETTARNYVESRESAQQRLADLTRDEGDWEGINNELVVAAQMQDAEIKATCQEIANFDYESDLAGGCQKIVGRTHRLLNSNDVLRDALQKALAEVAQQESRPPEAVRSQRSAHRLPEPGRHRGRSERLVGRRARSHPLVRGHDRHRPPGRGQRAIRLPRRQRDPQGDRQAAGGQPLDNVQVARFSGQRFLVMFSDVEMAAATNTVERCRQTIDNAHFEHKDFDIRITVSCA